MKKKLSWYFSSKKGLDREKNKDFFAIIDNKKEVLIIAFDISTTSLATTEMTSFFINLLSKKISDINIENTNILRILLNDTFKITKEKFKVGKASFLVFYYLYDSSDACCFHTGDIRLGYYQENNTIIWFTNVHTGANPLGESFHQNMIKNPRRQILTQCFNLQKEFKLDKTDIPITEDKLIIATDGFWAELDHYTQLAILHEEIHSSNDDLSIILFNLNCNSESLPNNIKENIIKIEI